MNAIIIHCDASYDDRIGLGTWGAVLQHKNETRHISKICPFVTGSNSAEFYAIIYSLSEVVKIWPTKLIYLHTDSLSCIQVIKSKGVTHRNHSKELYNMFNNIIKNNKLFVYANWVNRSVTNKEHQKAHYLAYAKLRKIRKSYENIVKAKKIEEITPKQTDSKSFFLIQRGFDERD